MTLWAPMMAGIAAAAAGQAAQVPGAMPAYSSVGTPTYTSGTVQATHTINVPSHSAGDLLILQVAMRNNNQDSVLASINTSGWTQFGGAGNTYGTTQNTHMGGGWKLGAGGNGVDTGEFQVQITCTGGATTDGVSARVLRFTAADGFSATAVQGLAPLTGVSSSLAMPTVVPSGNNQRAICLMAIGTSTTLANATGESGGDWTEPVAEDTTSGLLTLGVQTSSQAGGATISGGTVAAGGSSSYVTLGFTAVPALI